MSADLQHRSPCPRPTSTTCTNACRAPAGRSGRPSTTGRRASRSPTSRSCARTGPQLRLAPRRGRAEPLRAAAVHARGRRPGPPSGIQVAARPVAAPRRAPARARPTAGPARSSSSSTSSSRCATRPPTAATRPTRSTSSARRCPATGSATSRRGRLERRAHRRGLGRADDGPRLRPLRRARAGTGLGDHDRARRQPRRPRASGIHLNMVSAGPGKDMDELTEAEQASLARIESTASGAWATRRSSRRARRRSATGSSTRRRHRRRGSSRSSGRGPITTATREDAVLARPRCSTT